MKLLTKSPYIYIFLVLFVAYFGFVSYITDFWTTLGVALLYADKFNWYALVFSFALSIIISAFVGINGSYLYYGIRLRKGCKKSSIAATTGAVAGMAVGVCPICVGGILPLLLGIFGVSFSFAVLPFNGIEVQLAVIALLIFSYLNLKKKTTKQERIVSRKNMKGGIHNGK